MWSVALNTNEAAALAKGERPHKIRPANFLGYWPLDGIASPEPDFSGLAHNLTLTGSPAAANGPPIDLFTPKASTIFAVQAPIPGVGFQETTQFIVNAGRMMNRRGG